MKSGHQLVCGIATAQHVLPGGVIIIVAHNDSSMAICYLRWCIVYVWRELQATNGAHGVVELVVEIIRHCYPATNIGGHRHNSNVEVSTSRFSSALTLAISESTFSWCTQSYECKILPYAVFELWIETSQAKQLGNFVLNTLHVVGKLIELFINQTVQAMRICCAWRAMIRHSCICWACLPSQGLLAWRYSIVISMCAAVSSAAAI